MNLLELLVLSAILALLVDAIEVSTDIYTKTVL
jgi:hypothetical protein